MTAYDLLDKRIHELHDARFKEFEAEIVRKKALRDRAAKLEKGRDPRRQEFLKSIGIDPRKLENEEHKDVRIQEKELKAFLEEFRPKAAGRRSLRAADARDAAIRSATLAECGHLVLPPFATEIYAADKAVIRDTTGEAGSGAINSGWVFPDEPGRIRIKDYGHVGTACFEAYASPPPPEFLVHFGFVPATTATYEMTAVFAFHGFYILRSDDSWWNCRSAFVKLTIAMNVNQYADVGWKNFPALIDRNEQNVEEFTLYDRTHFFDYTAVLKAGDPVVISVKGVLDALGIGGGTYAELNFEAGTANYIEPLLLSVQQV
jgi:hypothetical protein